VTFAPRRRWSFRDLRQRADAFLSLAGRELDIEQRRRVRLVNWGGAVMAVMLSFWILNQVAYGAWPLAAWQAGSLLATLAGMAAVRRGRRLLLWAHWMCLAMMGSVFSAATYSGGLTPASLSLMLCVPVCAVVLAGRGGLWWTPVMIAGVVGMALAERQGVVFPYLTPEEWRRFDTVMTWLTSFLGITLVFAYNHAACARAERDQEAALAEARSVSDAKTRFLASLNREIREPLHRILGLMVLLKEEPAAERRRELGGEARRIGQALAGAVEGILRLARDEHLLEIQRERLAGPLRLPEWKNAHAAAKPAPAATAPVSLRVLVAEDDPVSRRLLVRNLAELGCEVAEAGDGRAALEALKGGGFALALIDCQLPGLDGFALARKLRRFEGEIGARRQRLIGMSAEASAAQAENCTAAGMDGFLPKPFGRADLEALLRQVRSPAES